MTAIYARYSSDSQRESSIDDQFRLCERWAAGQNLKVTLRYSDKAISGLSSDRDGYQKMLADAETGLFSLLIVDDLSRLGRDQVEREQIIRRMEFWGIRLVGVSDGYDSTMSKITRKTLRSVKGLFDEIYIDDLAHKTHRGLEGVALKGNSAGGKSYGYLSTPIMDLEKTDILAWKKAINPEQRRWVIYIFERTAQGATPRTIASELNEKGIPGARGGTWTASAINADQKRGLGMLINPLYIGQQIWNRSQWIKHPDTGKRQRIERPQEDWVIIDKPELRIIDQALWNKVQSILKAKRSKSQAQQKRLGPAARSGQPGKFLFSGLLRCAQCGGNYSMVNSTSFGCSRNKERGDSVCNNRIKVRRDLLEDKLLRSIKENIWNETAISYFIKTITKLLKEQTQSSEKARLNQQKEKYKTEIDNIMTAIKAGIITPTTKHELQLSEKNLSDTEKKLSNLNKTTQFVPKTAAAELRKMITDLENNEDIPATREKIKDLIGNQITLHPNGNHLIAELQTNVCKISMVAGAGYDANLEPVFVPLTKELQ